LLTKLSGCEPTLLDFATAGHVEPGTNPCRMESDATARFGRDSNVLRLSTRVPLSTVRVMSPPARVSLSTADLQGVVINRQGVIVDHQGVADLVAPKPKKALVMRGVDRGGHRS
jgi:hypothetical protein